MGAVALLRAGCSHRQLPLSDIKYRGARHPYQRGAGHLRISALEASAATSGAPSYSLGLAALSAYRRSTPTSTESSVKPFVALTQCTLPVFTDLQV